MFQSILYLHIISSCSAYFYPMTAAGYSKMVGICLPSWHHIIEDNTLQHKVVPEPKHHATKMYGEVEASFTFLMSALGGTLLEQILSFKFFTPIKAYIYICNLVSLPSIRYPCICYYQHKFHMQNITTGRTEHYLVPRRENSC
jgi:hypothetical protein